MNTQTDVQKQHEVGLGLFLGGLVVLILIGLLVSAYSRNPCAARPSLKGATSCNKECCARIRVVGNKTQPRQLRRYVDKALRTLDAFEQKANERGAIPATGLIVIGDNDNNDQFRVQKTIDVCGVTTSIANRAALTASVNDARARFIAFYEVITGEEWAVAVMPVSIVKTASGVVIPTLTSVTQDQVAKCENQIARYYEKKEKQAGCNLCAAMNMTKFTSTRSMTLKADDNQALFLKRDPMGLLLVNSKQKPRLFVGEYVVNEEATAKLPGVPWTPEFRWPDFVKTDKADQWRLDVDLFFPEAIPFYDIAVSLKIPEADFSVVQHIAEKPAEFEMTLSPVIAVKGGKAMTFTQAVINDTYIRAVKWSSMAIACQCTKTTL